MLYKAEKRGRFMFAYAAGMSIIGLVAEVHAFAFKEV